MIQFIAQWNGYEADAIHSLDSAEESRLVAAGLARYFRAGMDGTSTSGAVFVPSIPTTEAIIAAAQAARDAGGGYVDLSNIGDLTLTQSLPLMPGVIYRGAGAITYQVKGSRIVDGAPRLRGNGAFPAFAWNTADRVSAYTGATDQIASLAFHASECSGAGVMNVALSGFSDGIRAGALYEGGLVHMQISNLVMEDLTGWGLWLENCQQGYVRDVTVFDAALGHGAFIASSGNLPGGGEHWNHGNYVVENIFGQTSEAGDVHTAGWAFFKRGVGSHNLNDVHVHGIQSNLVKVRAYTGTNAATFSAGVLTVSDISKFKDESQIYFEAAPSGGTNIKANASYVVASATPTTGGAGTLTLTDKPGGSVISLAGLTGTLTVVNKGLPGLMIYGTVTYSSWTGVDIESWSTNSIFVAGLSGCKLDLQIVTAQPHSNSAFTARGLNPGNTVNAHQIYNAVDMADGDKFFAWNGPRPQVNHSGTGRGIGIQYVNMDTGGQHASTANTTRVELGDSRHISGSTDSKSSWFNLLGFSAMTVDSTSANMGGDWGQLISYSGTANGTLGILSLTDSRRGLPYFFSNASAFTWTINTSGGQTIDGAAGVTSIVIPAYTTAVLMGSKTAAGTRYWARLK